MAIFDANNGGPFPGTEPESLLSGIWTNVFDTPGLVEKWGVDQEGLVARMQQLNPGEAIALAEACRYFWDFCGEDTDKLLKDLGVA